MSNDNAAIYAEMSQDLVAMTALSDDGDQTKYNSADRLWSKRSGYTADVKPNGVATGLSITPGAANDTVAVSAGTCYLAGVLTSVSADSALSVPRPAVSNYQQLAITVTSAGALAVVEGSEHTAFSETWDADGGSPLIPVGSILLGIVKYSSQTSAVVSASEIKQTSNSYRESYNFPTWAVRAYEVENSALGYAGVDFDAALLACHTGGIPKAVYAEYYTPEFAKLAETTDFVPPETSHSVSSTQIYGKTKGSSSSSLGQGSFTAYFEDGISDAMVTMKNESLFFKFFQDELVTSKYILCQGKLGLTRSFSPEEDPQGSCTISATDEAVEVTA
ncbi:hypothetical protein [uncultured Desulfobacter sp.]|uniref:hypothetical protein n=1 Tax=uncultured Desulfobacter sp. TaxID=240139 RepID=UPI0029C8E021|nr:hypothetical protein [uncultured Desulfobacter sp.]